jgi:hypothetical protein
MIMAKKRSYQTHTGPEIVDMDVIATMTDDELVNRFQRMDVEREAMRETRIPTREWEIEIAYVRREQQLRRTRREAHDSYLNAMHASSPELDVLADEFIDHADAALAQA